MCVVTCAILAPGHPQSLHRETGQWTNVGKTTLHLLFNFGKESTCDVGDLGSIPGLGRSPGEGKGHPLQYSGLENSMGYIVHGVAKSWTQLGVFHFHFTLDLSPA